MNPADIQRLIEGAVDTRLAASGMGGGNNILMREGDYGEVRHPVRIFEAYRQYQAWEAMQESGTTSDFQTYLSNALNKQFFEAYDEVQSEWRQYSGIRSLADFKKITLVGLSELDNLIEVTEDGQYEDSQMNELPGPEIQMGTFGRLFSLSRKAMINDDLGKFNDIPGKMGEAANRTLAEQVVAVIANNATAYDGKALYHLDHNNLGSAALSETSLPLGIVAVRIQTNQNGRRTNFRPETLVVSAQNEFTAARILQSTEVNTNVEGQGTKNVVQGVVRRVIVEPFLTDANDWYLFANPRRAPAIMVGFLNGNQQPTLMQHREVQLMRGGFDPYRLEVDKLTWKIRHDWGVAAGEWRGTYKSVVA